MSYQCLRRWLVVALVSAFVGMSMLPAISQALATDSPMTMTDCEGCPDEMPCDGSEAPCLANFGCVVLSTYLPTESSVARLAYRSASVHAAAVAPLHGRSIAPNLEPPILLA